MGQGLWRVARNQQLQQEGYSEQGYLTREQSRRMAASNISNANHRRQAQGGIDIYHLLKTRKSKEQEGFINLEMLPPELSFTILSYLNATDLCLASCVWQDLANDELLWQGLCKSTWGHCSIYNKNPPLGFSFRRLYMQLDEGSLTFNANPDEGVNYFMSKGILDDSPKEIAKFIFCTRTLNWKKLRIYLDERRDVLDDLVTLHNFRNQFLPNALREFFRHIHAPEERGEYLETLITKFSHRFCACNPDLMRELGLSPDFLESIYKEERKSLLMDFQEIHKPTNKPSFWEEESRVIPTSTFVLARGKAEAGRDKGLAARALRIQGEKKASRKLLKLQVKEIRFWKRQ